MSGWSIKPDRPNVLRFLLASPKDRERGLVCHTYNRGKQTGRFRTPDVSISMSSQTVTDWDMGDGWPRQSTKTVHRTVLTLSPDRCLPLDYVKYTWQGTDLYWGYCGGELNLLPGETLSIEQTNELA